MKKRLLALMAFAVLLGAVALVLRHKLHPVPVPPPPVVVEPAAADPGALVKVTMRSKVGVLLEDIPATQRGALVKSLVAKPESYWIERATRQVRLTSLRRNYGIKYGAEAVPLPPEDVWHVHLVGKPARENVDGHDLVTVGYDYDGTILTDTMSPGVSAKELGTVGGVWKDMLVLPLDPDFLLQRTGYACMNESESPPNSVDAEQAWFFFDQKCGVEKKLNNLGCHQSALPTESCVQAVQAHIGAVRPEMAFERLSWDAALADEVRVGAITNPDGPDLVPIQERFQEYRVAYRYIPADSCTLVEKCVGGPGWRQLLMFPTGDLNSGAEALDIGKVDYFQQTGGTLLSEHGVYEFSACHQHYHFRHYGSFTLGNGLEAINRKQAFCLQPTSRLMNTEESPMNHSYSNCIDQGVEVGWLDEYVEGLECQWLDVTDVPAQRGVPITFQSNPDGMMCEGTRKFDERGRQLFEPTKFKTEEGQPVDRPQCDFFPGWDANNKISYTLDVPQAGEGYVTEPCRDDVFGPLRNCDLHKEKKRTRACTPGSEVKLHCDVAAGSASQVLRVCEASQVMQTGIPCTFNDALANSVVSSAADLTFVCPVGRDELETGGQYALFTGAMIPEDGMTPVTCSATETLPGPSSAN